MLDIGPSLVGSDISFIQPDIGLQRRLSQYSLKSPRSYKTAPLLTQSFSFPSRFNTLFGT